MENNTTQVLWADCLASDKKNISYVEKQVGVWSVVPDYKNNKNFKAYNKQFDKLKMAREKQKALEEEAKAKEEAKQKAVPLRPGDENYKGVMWSKIEETDKGWKPYSHSDNTRAILEHRGVTVAYDEMAKEPFIDIPGRTIHNDTKFNTQLVLIEDMAQEERYPKTDVVNHLVAIGNEKHFHPVKDWILAKEWDGVDRFEALIATVDTTDTPLFRMMMNLWMRNAIAAVFSDGKFSGQGVLTLVGKQGLGKTRWLMSLVDNSEWVAEGLNLNLNDKDSVLRVLRHWIVELGEIDTTFRKSDISALKGFITSQKDILRPPYARKAETFKRRTVMTGTVNEPNFLQDTENRRFWCANVNKLNPNHNIDIQQLWAQMYHEWMTTTRWNEKEQCEEERYFWMLPEQQRWLAVANKKYMTFTSVIQKFEERFTMVDAEDALHPEMHTVTQLCEILDERPDNKTLSVLAGYLEHRGFQKRLNNGKFKVARRSGKLLLENDKNEYWKDDEEIAEQRQKWLRDGDEVRCFEDLTE